MQERIEPPILVSRLMAFVMATSLVVLGVLVFTLDKMFPLNRPQVFFLTSQKLSDKELTLTKMPTNNLDGYKQKFVQEYVRARNEITGDLAIMRAKWANNQTGLVRSYSTDPVYGEFSSTKMAQVIHQADNLDVPFTIECSVEFPDRAPIVKVLNAGDTYLVTFAYRCFDGGLEDDVYIKQVKLRVSLVSTAGKAVRWADRMQNPLGLRVDKYEIINGQDPLDWTWQEETGIAEE